MRLLSIMFVFTCLVLASNFVSADAKDKEISYKIDGQTLTSKDIQWDHNFQTNYDVQGNLKIQRYATSYSSSGGGPNKVIGYGVIDSSKYAFTGNCWTKENDFGSALTNSEAVSHNTFTWPDESTLTIERFEFNICEAIRVEESGAWTYLGYGDGTGKHRIIDGTGRYEGATGIMESEFTYRRLYLNQFSLSGRGLVSYKATLD